MDEKVDLAEKLALIDHHWPAPVQRGRQSRPRLRRCRPPGPDVSATALAVQPNGKVLVAGIGYSRRDGDFAVARYTRDGMLDTTYANGGTVATDLGSQSDDQATAARLQRAGKLVSPGSPSQRAAKPPISP